MAKAKAADKIAGAAGVGTDGDYVTGVEYKVGITNPQYAKVGNLTPGELRAINIKKRNIKQQEKWAKEWLKAVTEIEDCRREIEKIRAEIEVKHFKTEQEIDEYVLTALKAKVGYEAHYREWMARKNLEFGLINQVADGQIRVVAASFADKARVWKARHDRTIAESKENADAEVAMLGRARDKSGAIADAQAKARMKAFVNGESMEVVNAIGGNTSGSSGSASSSKSLLDAFSFNF